MDELLDALRGIPTERQMLERLGAVDRRGRLLLQGRDLELADLCAYLQARWEPQLVRARGGRRRRRWTNRRGPAIGQLARGWALSRGLDAARGTADLRELHRREVVRRFRQGSVTGWWLGTPAETVDRWRAAAGSA